MNKQQFLDLLDKYLAGHTTQQEDDLLLQVYQYMEDKFEWTAAELDSLDHLEAKLIQRFKAAIKQDTDTIANENYGVKRIVFNKRVFLQIAASLLLVLGFSVLYFASYKTRVNVGQVFAGKASDNITTYTNNTNAIQKIMFPDGSYVNLAKGSKIGYDKQFAGNKRQVYLEGEGFFQVTKNHAKPFIVYTDKLVTKVLGTSFIVNSGINNSKASVLVKTGKVSVFKAKEFTEENAKPDLTGGVVLTPNHLANLNNAEEFEKRIATSPEVLKTEFKDHFDFDNTPVETVFEKLQAAYGINIRFDKEKMRSCSVTVNMGKEGFYQKLDVICRTLNASYQVVDGDVLISGAGCTN